MSKSHPLESFQPGALTESPYLSAQLWDSMPRTANALGADLPSHLAFTNDIYGSAAQKPSIQNQLLATTDPNKIHFTTPAEDKKSGSQPQFYLNAEGKLVANPRAKPSKDGSINIEVEGNNSAKQAKQYADQLQRNTIRDLISAYKIAHPGGKIPEMWQSIVDASPNPDLNTGDQQNNNTVTPAEESAYDGTASPTPPQPSEVTPPQQPMSSPEVSSQPSSSPTGGDTGSGGGSGGSGGSGGGGGDTGGSGGGGDTGGSGGGGGDTRMQGAPSTGSSGSSSVDTGPINTASVTGQDIVQNAVADASLPARDRELWNDKPGMVALTRNGDLGCAESVCHVLKQSGITGVDSALVSTMRAQLLSNGGQEVPINQAQPGDVVIFGNNDHTGIMGPNGTFYANSSRTGEWTKYNSVADIGQTVTAVVRPPEAHTNPKVRVA